MKTFARFTPVLLLLLCAAATQALSVNEAKPGARVYSDHQVVLKMERKDIGASVEIFYSNGDRIVSQQLEKRKVIIDFGHVRVGEYTIRIKKGNDIQDYMYVKK